MKSLKKVPRVVNTITLINLSVLVQKLWLADNFMSVLTRALELVKITHRAIPATEQAIVKECER